jgi:hypothetical protein
MLSRVQIHTSWKEEEPMTFFIIQQYTFIIIMLEHYDQPRGLAVRISDYWSW